MPNTKNEKSYLDYDEYIHSSRLSFAFADNAKEYFAKNPLIYKQVKKMIIKSTGELAKFINVKNAIVVTFHKKKVVGIAMLSLYSPEKHFKNEDNIESRYLYNMIVLPNRLKIGPSTLTEIKKYCKFNGVKQINLDVLLDDVHVTKFYLNNRFEIKDGYTNIRIMHDYKKESVKYICMTYTFIINA